ncbi:hypothetical protein RFI_28182, partial [Reticulomyxa filosa]
LQSNALNADTTIDLISSPKNEVPNDKYETGLPSPNNYSDEEEEEKQKEREEEKQIKESEKDQTNSNGNGNGNDNDNDNDNGNGNKKEMMMMMMKEEQIETKEEKNAMPLDESPKVGSPTNTRNQNIDAEDEEEEEEEEEEDGVLSQVHSDAMEHLKVMSGLKDEESEWLRDDITNVHTHKITAMISHPSGHLIVTGDQHGSIRFWKVHSQRKWIKPMKVSNWPVFNKKWSCVQCLTVSATGAFVAAGGSVDSQQLYGLVCVYPISKNGTDISKPKAIKSGVDSRFVFASVTAIAFTTDDTYLVAGDHIGNVLVMRRCDTQSDDFELIRLVSTKDSNRINAICTHDQNRFVLLSKMSNPHLLACDSKQLLFDPSTDVIFQSCPRPVTDKDAVTGIVSTKHGLFVTSKKLQLYQLSAVDGKFSLQIDRKFNITTMMKKDLIVSADVLMNGDYITCARHDGKNSCDYYTIYYFDSKKKWQCKEHQPRTGNGEIARAVLIPPLNPSDKLEFVAICHQKHLMQAGRGKQPVKIPQPCKMVALPIKL